MRPFLEFGSSQQGLFRSGGGNNASRGTELDRMPGARACSAAGSWIVDNFTIHPSSSARTTCAYIYGSCANQRLAPTRHGGRAHATQRSHAPSSSARDATCGRAIRQRELVSCTVFALVSKTWPRLIHSFVNKAPRPPYGSRSTGDTNTWAPTGARARMR